MPQELRQGPIGMLDSLTQGPDMNADAYRGGILGKLLAKGIMGLLGGPSRQDVLGPSVLQQQAQWSDQTRGLPVADRLKSLSPMAENLGMNAAAIKAYHGSPLTNLSKISADPPSRQFDNATSQFGAFFSPTVEGAKRYAGQQGRVYPATAPIERPYEMSWNEFGKFQAPNKGADGRSLPGEQWAARAEELKSEAAALRDKLAQAGHDGIVVKNSKGETVEIASFNDAPVTGLLAYHGSPHSFDKFDISKIGTGEGAQAYGHGLYFAENPAVAGDYAKNVIDKPWFDAANARLSELAKEMDRYSAGGYRKFSDPRGEAAATEYDRLLQERANKKGNTYEVQINAEPHQFLDWDKPLSAQADPVRGRLMKAGFSGAANDTEFARGLTRLNKWMNSADYSSSWRDSSDLRRDMTKFLDVWEGKGDQAAIDWMKANPNSAVTYKAIPDRSATFVEDVARGPANAARLKDAGIPGIKYLDQGSRSAGAGSSNYTVFDDSIIQILRKYGLLGPMVGGAAASQGDQ